MLDVSACHCLLSMLVIALLQLPRRRQHKTAAAAHSAIRHYYSEAVVGLLSWQLRPEVSQTGGQAASCQSPPSRARRRSVPGTKAATDGSGLAPDVIYVLATGGDAAARATFFSFCRQCLRAATTNGTCSGRGDDIVKQR